MAKKGKEKTTTTARQKATVAKPKAKEQRQPELAVETQVHQVAPTGTAETATPESPRADVPAVAPSVAVTARKAAAVPVAVRVPASEPASPVAPSGPTASEPPPSGLLAILSVKTEADAGVTLKNLSAYRRYLEKYLDRPARVCGRAPFGWERPFAWGLRDRAIYEMRKTTCPSYTDVLEIVGFDEDVDVLDGVSVRAARPTDGKAFSLSLASLKSADAGSSNAAILDEFAEWFTEVR
jgi:hypothetical protein